MTKPRPIPRPDYTRIARLEHELGMNGQNPPPADRQQLIVGWGDVLDDENIAVDGYGRVFIASTPGSHALGNITPGPGGYRMQIEMGYRAIGPDATLHSGLYFGRSSAETYRFGAPNGTPGYHLVMRQNGLMRLFRHVSGSAAGVALGGGDIRTRPPRADEAMTIEIDVTPTTVEARRLGDSSWTTGPILDVTHRGGHFGLSNGSVKDVSLRAFWDYLIVTEL
ncbi:hypothetical protein [Streptomyces sp. B1I3]|uniref:hypothetical protein n=1 Tax=Streptomyces sp. B1I3 TaxID=3042264 RepID=UPI00277F528E|nr:hypothetical protein [Streptomyces sp. B1I3]MDQ0791932.1 hypothetical protein [Streptomyces sp. B1I3]